MIPLIRRLVRGTRRSWRSERHRDRLPPGLDAEVMHLRSTDRLHRKQGRSTCRVRWDSPAGPLIAYLKRHERLPWPTRLLALVHPGGWHSPAGAELRHLLDAKGLGIPVAEPVAAGERIGPWGRLRSYLLVEELTGFEPLHEAIPRRHRDLDPPAFRDWKRRLALAVADVAAGLHAESCFHKDLYLCHFFVDDREGSDPADLRIIDLHRLGRHRLASAWWRCKDLGQLLFSTFDVEGVDDRDRLRFWVRYRRRVRVAGAGWQARIIRLRAARYRRHDRRRRTRATPALSSPEGGAAR